MEASGFSSGILVMSDDQVISLRLKQADRFILHLEARMVGGLARELTAIYASPNSSIRRHLWERLDIIEVWLPWALIGDFNCVLADEERSLNTRAFAVFQNWVRGRGLIDLGFI